MENATKGLMIAGAILIAIVLIGIGVALISGAQGFLEQGTSEMDSMERSAFNSKIEQYEGKRSGANIKTLLTTLNSINTELNNEGTLERIIGIKLTDNGNELLEVTAGEAYTSSNVITARSKVNTGRTYTVTLGYNDTTGLVNNVTITAGTTSTTTPTT